MRNILKFIEHQMKPTMEKEKKKKTCREIYFSPILVWKCNGEREIWCLRVCVFCLFVCFILQLNQNKNKNKNIEHLISVFIPFHSLNDNLLAYMVSCVIEPVQILWCMRVYMCVVVCDKFFNTHFYEFHNIITFACNLYLLEFKIKKDWKLPVFIQSNYSDEEKKTKEIKENGLIRMT